VADTIIELKADVVQDTDAGTSTTLVVTVPANANCLLIRVAGFDDTPPIGTITSVTVNGVAATLITSIDHTASSANIVAMYYYMNPPSGGNTVVANYSAGFFQAILSVASLAGVHPYSPIGTPATAEGATGVATVDVTSAAGEKVFDVVSSFSGARTVGAGQIVDYTYQVIGGDFGSCGSREDGAATVTMSWSSVADIWIIAGVSFKPNTIPERGYGLLRRSRTLR
jgi:hypothetical protein